MTDGDLCDIPNQMTIEKTDKNIVVCNNCGFESHVNNYVIDYDTVDQQAFLQCPNCNKKVP